MTTPSVSSVSDKNGDSGDALASADATATAGPLAFVDPTIGAIAPLLVPTLPIVNLPHGMARVAPVRDPNPPDPILADKVIEFPLTILAHRGARAFGIMAGSGPMPTRLEDAAAEADQDHETAAPHFHSVRLDEHEITVEFTVTEHCVIYRFRFARPGEAWILLRTHRQGALVLLDPSTLRGWEEKETLRCCFHAVLSRPCDWVAAWRRDSFAAGESSAEGEGVALLLGFTLPGAETIELRAGLSLIDAEQARANLEGELEDRRFEIVTSEAARRWNDALGGIEVFGGSDKHKRIFYTALYRSLERPISISEQGRYFSAYDRRVHDDDGVPFYVDDWTWDTFRTVHPLQLLLDPDRQRDMIRSYIRMYEQWGWMPRFPLAQGNRAVMVGFHIAAIVADAWSKGVRDFDLEKAYEGLRKTALEGTLLPWRSGPLTELDRFYHDHGYYPALEPGREEWVERVDIGERRQAVAVTLEDSYGAWCLAQLAEALGKTADAAAFRKRAQNYRNVFNPATGFMVPRGADGRWIEPFDPKFSGGPGSRDYFTECNSWVYTWFVPHDIPGLIELMGGPGRFRARLDQLFNESLGTSKYTFYRQFPDATGLLGQFPMGNEPGFHIPYLYDLCGAPWRTQKRVRRLMTTWFDDTPHGICGDEDGGALSSWFAFSAMGFYPICPGLPVYFLGSPLFEKITFHIGGKTTFAIEVRNASSKNKYIQSAVLNDRPLESPWFYHSDLVDGGTLQIDLGPYPNREWGNSPPEFPRISNREP